MKLKFLTPIITVTGLGVTVAPIAAMTSCSCNSQKATIKLNKNETNILVGDDETLIATVTPSETAVSWTSSDESIATVDTNGKVTAKAKGTATITAEAGGEKANCVVNVGIEIVPVCIEASDSFTFSLKSETTAHWTGETSCKLEYSTDGDSFAEWDGTTSIECENKKIYLRGTGIVSFAESDESSDSTTFKVEPIGTVTNFSWSLTANADLRALLNYQDVTKAVMGDYCFSNLFENNTTLTSIPAGLLPFKTLSTNCYSSMFYGCTGLTSVPESLLPAATLVGSCYAQMFRDCTKLITLPAGLLPAGKDGEDKLAEYCYMGMFKNCSGLKTLPSELLPATILKAGCYGHMFDKCTNLTTTPILNSTDAAGYTYYSMFNECTTLKICENTIPETATSSGLVFTCPSSPGDKQVTNMFFNTVGTFAAGTPAANNKYYWYIEQE